MEAKSEKSDGQIVPRSSAVRNDRKKAKERLSLINGPWKRNDGRRTKGGILKRKPIVRNSNEIDGLYCEASRLKAILRNAAWL